MWGEFCNTFSPNAEKHNEQPKDAIAKYTAIALVRYTLRKILNKK